MDHDFVVGPQHKLIPSVVDCLINHELEVENLQKAVEVLSQVREKTVLDGYLVYWRAVPVGKAYKPPNPDPVWVEIDPAWVQIVKCQQVVLFTV